MSLRNQFRGSKLYCRDHPRGNQFPSVDRQWMGDSILSSKGFHAGLHDRTRLHGQAEFRVRQAQLQGYRAQ
jgi:hypothetical protein